MNILSLSTFDSEGGAARAAYRLHLGMQSLGVDSRMLVLHKASNDPLVTSILGSIPSKIARIVGKTRSRLDRTPVLLYPRRREVLYIGWLPSSIEAVVRQAPAPDIVHLHWISAGFVPITAIAGFQPPIVWTLHDMWAFTGGCYYDQECGRYTNSCGCCPQLASTRENDLTRWVWQRKRMAWEHVNMTIVTPSRWLASCAKASSLLCNRRIEVIPNSLDLALFRPSERGAARARLGLPPDQKLILFGAVKSTHDRRKGFHFIQEALHQVASRGWRERATAVIFGATTPDNPPTMGLPTHYMGLFHDDEKLVQLYAAADVFVAPSIQDNLPNTVMEALACGTPCVAFRIGGMPDLIEHEQNGYLATPFDTGDLAHGIIQMMEDSRYDSLSHYARQKAEHEWSMELQSRRYVALYQSIKEGRKR